MQARTRPPAAPGGRCTECGFPRNHRSAATRERHRVVHDQWCNGVRLRGAAQFEPVGECLDFQLLLSGPTSLALARWTTDLTIDQLLRDQLKDDGGGTTDTRFPIPQPKPKALLRHALLLSDGHRILGGLFFEWRPLAGVHRWDTPLDVLEPASGPPVNDWCLSYAWLHHTVRRRHIGPMAAAVVARGLNRPPADLLFLPPFTRKGVSVSRAVSPGRVRVARAAYPDNYNNLVYPFARPSEPSDSA
jgi:hypothetical protein